MNRSDIYFILLDYCNDEIFTFIEEIRRLGEHSYFVFVINDDKDLPKLICPSIRPSAILRNPIRELDLEKVINEIMIDQRKRILGQENLSLKIEGEIYKIPLSMILYIEAKNKKMILRTFGQEISFYSTFSQVQEKLNDSFIRCHKGFLVNGNEIKLINCKESCIVLTNGYKIPYSRSYKENVMKWIERSEMK